MLEGDEWKERQEMDVNPILKNIQQQLGADWQKFTEQNKKLVTEIAQDMLDLQLDAVAGLDVKDEMKQIKYQLSGMNAIVQSAIADAFQRSLNQVAGVLGSFAKGLLL